MEPTGITLTSKELELLLNLAGKIDTILEGGSWITIAMEFLMHKKLVAMEITNTGVKYTPTKAGQEYATSFILAALKRTGALCDAR